MGSSPSQLSLNQPRSPWMTGWTGRQASTRTVPYYGVPGSIRDSSGSGFAAAGSLWQVTRMPCRGGRPLRPGQVTGSPYMTLPAGSRTIRCTGCPVSAAALYPESKTTSGAPSPLSGPAAP